MNQQRLLTLEKYTELAGNDWPVYHDYVSGKIPNRFRREISSYEEMVYTDKQKHLLETAEKYNSKYANLKSPHFLIRFLLIKILPAVIGTSLYFYLGGTLLKFFVLFLCFRFLNIMFTMVLHRWLCHHMFEPKGWARPILLWIAVAGCRGHNGNWIRSHWAHHKDADTELDPYPPSWGLANLSLVTIRYYKLYAFGRWMVAPDIKFVMRNMWWLWALNAALFAYIDLDIFLLGFLFIGLISTMEDGASNFILHDGFDTNKPVNFPVFGYFMSLFVGIESVHAVHHDRPWVFNQAKHVPGAIDIGYWLMRPFAKTERE